MTPSEWIKQLLDRCDIEKPDGRPLYQYRLTENDFGELVKLLKLSSHFGIAHISQKMLSWDAALVFYASEWWRRDYAGKWGWDGIFESLGLDLSEISIGRRNTLIEVGLRRWGRDVRVRDGQRKFLGTIATEGGLPLNQLAEAGGWLKNILGPVVKKRIARNFDVEVLIDAYEDAIPKSYRSIEIKQVLEDIVLSVVDLRSTYKLQDRENPLDWLDSHVPEWWGVFPLPVDNDIARSLLRELIVIAGDTSVVERGNPFVIERVFVNVNFQPELQARLNVPRYITQENLPELDFGALPGRFEIDVVDDNGVSSPWCRVIQTEHKGYSSLRLSGRSLLITDDRALLGLKLQCKSLGGVLSEISIIDGDALDKTIPWVFKETGDLWALHGVASHAISDEKTLAYIPDMFEIMSQTETTSCLLKNKIFDGCLYEISGRIVCRDDNEKYQLKTGASESYKRYHLSGKTFRGVSRPSDIYIGAPTLYETNVLTGFSRRSNEFRLLAKPLGVDIDWKPIGEVCSGYYEVRLNDAEGNICWRRRIGLLENNFGYKLLPDRTSPSKGVLQLSGYDEAVIAINESSVSVHIDQSVDVSSITLQALNRPPMFVSVSLLHDGHKNDLRLDLPFPARGAILYTPDGIQMKFHRALFLNSLYGYRIRVFDDRYYGTKTANIRFSLIDSALSNNDRRDMSVDRLIKVNAQVTELAIIDWYKIIQELLSVSSSLDALVRISLELNSGEMFRLNIRRYEYDFQPEWDCGTVKLAKDDSSEMELTQFEGIKVQAFRIQQPEQHVCILEPEMSEGCFLGRWRFLPETRDDGAWLIFPSDDSDVQFRPLLWAVNNEGASDIPVALESIHILQHAMKIADQMVREESLRSVMYQMANDLEHRSWDYLNNLWAVSKHLPLPTFDIWRLSVSEPGFLAALLVQGDYDEVIERLEDELPIIWELVRIKDWCKALRALRDRYSNRLSNELGMLATEDEGIIKAFVMKRVDRIANVSFSMKRMSMVLGDMVFSEKSKELDLMKMPIDVVVKPNIDQAFQEMMRRQSESKWPELLAPQIREIYEGLPKSLKGLVEIHQNFRAATTYLPIILAWRAYNDDNYGWLGSAVNIFKLQQIRNFDEDWFSIVFEFLSAWLSQQELTVQKELA